MCAGFFTAQPGMVLSRFTAKKPQFSYFHYFSYYPYIVGSSMLLISDALLVFENNCQTSSCNVNIHSKTNLSKRIREVLECCLYICDSIKRVLLAFCALKVHASWSVHHKA